MRVSGFRHAMFSIAEYGASAIHHLIAAAPSFTHTTGTSTLALGSVLAMLAVLWLAPFTIAGAALQEAEQRNWIWNAWPVERGTSAVRAPSEHFGAPLSSVPDLDGDGARDLLIGAPYADDERGCVYGVSSASGSILFRCAGKSTDVHLGLALTATGDLDGDGHGDWLACAISTTAVPARLVVRGFDARGRELFEHSIDENWIDSGAIAITDATDLDRDGCADYFLNSGLAVEIAAVSGASGNVLYRVADPLTDVPSWDEEHPTCRSLRQDLDGDGVSELVTTRTFRLVDATTVWLVLRSGRTGVPILRVTDDVCGNFGWSIDVARDADSDGVADIVIGSPDMDVNCSAPSGVRVYSGQTLQTIAPIRELDPGGYFEGFGASVAWIRDRDRDGSADVIVGCEEVGDAGDSYYAAIFDGRTGSARGKFYTDHKMVQIASLDCDLDGDGLDEVLLGLPEIDRVWIMSCPRPAPYSLSREWRKLVIVAPFGREPGAY